MLKKKHLLFSERGVLTVQFMFGMVLVLIFIFLFSLMSFTLAVASVTQYITYSSARQLFLGHKDIGAQKRAAADKYYNLIKNSSVEKIFGGDLFVITDPSRIQTNGMGINSKFSTSGTHNLFYGVWTKFHPKVLQVETFWGDVEGRPSEFETSVGSYLGEQPTQYEVQSWFKRFDNGN